MVHLTLAVERIQKGEGIKINLSYLEDQKMTKEYRFAERIVSQLELVFQISIPEAEIAYITMHLKGAKLRHENEHLIEDASLQVAMKTKKLIETVGKLVGMNLSTHPSLFEGLMVHLKPAIYRIKEKDGHKQSFVGKD